MIKNLKMMTIKRKRLFLLCFSKENENLYFIFARKIFYFNNYIAGFDVEIDTIDQNTKALICNMLQKELNTDITDINILLQMVKEKNNQLILSRKRSNV